MRSAYTLRISLMDWQTYNGDSQMKIHTAQMTNSLEREEWYTPAQYIHAVKSVLLNIDLDPCSCAFANETVQAGIYINREENALLSSWPIVQTLYANPPYSAGVIAKFVERILDHHLTKGFQTGIVLINNVSDTKYWQQLAKASSLFCNTDHRICFVDSNGFQSKSNTRGQTIFLLTAQHSTAQHRFISSFRKYGVIAKAII